MPRKPTDAEQMDKWNFYVPRLLKAEFVHTLVKNGHDRCQSAALRALMELYATGQIPEDKIAPLIEKHKVFKQDSTLSKL